ncbi:hypothetical protein FKM82_025631 [Ascaphus truei]
MKLGLALIVIGHLNFIVGAIVHGLVLRHVARLQDTVSLQYSVANITAVVSAILRLAVLILSIINAVLSLACTVGLAVSVIITVANAGRTLLSTCTFTHLELIQISHECPFDPTRIYSTTLCLWAISISLDVAEVVFSVRCFLAVLQLMDVRLCRQRRRKVRRQLPRKEEDESIEREGLNTDCGDSVWL